MNNIEFKLDKLLHTSPELYKVKKTFLNILHYIDEQDWMGACHASTAIMFVLLKEQGFDVVACIGEVSNPPIIFDHSWIEYDGNVIDAAISNTLIQGLKYPPVFLNIDLSSEQETKFKYGCNSGELDSLANIISKMSIGSYMDSFPGHPQGLWGIAKELASKQSLDFNINSTKSKYTKTEWVIKT